MKVAITQDEETTIHDPLTGEQVDISDPDALAEAYVRIEATVRDMSAALRSIRRAFGDLSSGSARTRRVRGQRHRVRVEMPAPTWDQLKLKTAWIMWPKLAQEFIRIERFAPKLIEVRKLREETGAPEFEAFRNLLLDAEEEPTQPPRIFVETSTESELKEQEWALRGALKASVQDE